MYMFKVTHGECVETHFHCHHGGGIGEIMSTQLRLWQLFMLRRDEFQKKKP